jgi:hypothetical protein
LYWLKKHIAKSSSVTILIIGIICFLLIQEFRWEGDNGKAHKDIISSDGVGYYSYLPNIFIHNNLSNQPFDNRYILKYQNRSINKYYVGTAIAMSPFFALGYVLADDEERLDGLSPPFHKAISLGAIFYLILGLLFLKLLLELYQTKDGIIAIVLALITFGTNLLIYTVDSPSLSHIYSFCFVTGFLYFSKRLFILQSTSSIYCASFLLGMVILIRPLNGLVILTIPFLAGSINQLKITTQTNVKPLVLSIIILIGVLFIQFYFNHLQTGEFLVWNYKNEGFYFSNPEIWNVLFGFRKGWFIYTPLAFVSILGLIFLIKQNKFAFSSLLIFFIILIYFASSWWNWYYGPSFSQRPFVEFYGLIGVILASIFTQLQSQKVLKAIILTICILLVGLNVVQSYQYNKKIISSWDMNFEKYQYTFLKTGDEYIKLLGGNNDIWLYESNPKEELTKTLDFNSNEDSICDFTDTEFKASFEIPITENLLAERGLFAQISLDRYEVDINSCSKALFVIEVVNANKESYHYYRFLINETPNNEQTWKTYQYKVEIPPIKNLGDTIKIYIWNKEKLSFYVDNFSMKIFSVN